MPRYSPEVSNCSRHGFRRAHKYEHALYVWDEFYTPFTDFPDDWNDYGNVHHNANLVSVLAWRMYEAGMSPRDVFDFWFAFDLVLTPKTDFAETAMKAAWCAEIAGLSEYAPVIQRAVEDLRLKDKSLPEDLPEHQGMITFVNPLDTSYVRAVFYDPWKESEFTTWPVNGTDSIAAVFSEGSFYMVSVKSSEDDTVFIWNVAENRWEAIDPESLRELYGSQDTDYCVRIDGGSITEIGD